MTNIQFPQSPAQVYRETKAQVVAYNTGVVLRIIWEVSKPILGWVVFLSAVMVLGAFYFMIKVIFGSLRP
jgi:hypothetical protein